MMRRITKTDLVRVMLNNGLPPRRIANELGVSVERVWVVRWLMEHPNYNTEHMRRTRATDADYGRKERAYQRQRRHRLRVAGGASP